MPSLLIEIRGQSFEADLPDAPVRVGSAPDADLCIQGEGVAVEHCTLEPLANGLHKLSDARSGYPTRVNGIVVKQVSLKGGDIVEVGEARLVYRQAGIEMQVPRPAVPEPLPPRTPAAAPARPAPARRAPRPAPAPAAAAAPRPVAAAPSGAAETPSRKRKEGRRGLVGGLVGLLAAGAALAVILLAVGGEDGDAGLAAARKAYQDGRRRYEAKDFTGARRAWEKLASDPRAGAARSDAENGLALLGDVERELDLKLGRLWSERLDLGPDAMAPVRESFVRTYGEQNVGRFDAMRDRVFAAQRRWKDDELQRVGKEVQAFVGDARFAQAAAAWRRLGRTAPAAIDMRADVEAGLARLEQDAAQAATAHLERAQGWIDDGEAFRAVILFEDLLPRYAGLAAQGRIEAGLRAAREARDRAFERQPPTPPTAPTPGQPPPTAPTPPPDEAAAKAQAARVAKLEGEVTAHREACRFLDAAGALDQLASSLPAGAARERAAASAADLRLAEQGLVRLIADIQARPGRYNRIKLTSRLSVSIVDADRESLSAAVTGGRSKHRWERVASAAFADLAARMAPGKDDAVAVATLLFVIGQVEPSERMLYRAGEKGVDTGVLFRALARWRGEPIPEGGYVVHENRYVTPAQRTFLLREARIAAALAKLSARDAAERQAAYSELLEIGEPAQERFRSALVSQRRFLADQMVASRSFTGSKYKAKLLQLLGERRKHALALIYDARAYPYPNPQKKSQKEVEARVDLVREVWERPFDLVAQWDKKLGEHLASISEVDGVLSQVDAGYRPDLDEIKARINKAIDVPSAADPSIREYSLKVLGYNETLETTATFEEKDNVRVVNEYRMMMGLQSVKINERLVRAARGHSRHMQQNNYFAHDVPAPYATPQNRSPGARAKVQGFGGGVGENIARGPSTGRGAFQAWFGSSGHHRNMLGRGWLLLGCGRAGGTWWTQNFGSGSKSLKAPDPLPAPEAAFAPDPEDARGRPTPRGKIEVPEDEPPPGDPGPPPADEPPPDDEPR